MANEQNLKPFLKGEDPRRNIDGRPEGVKNRSTIAKHVLEMVAILPDDVFDRVKELFPGIDKRMTAEEISTLVLLGNAISKGDVNAYKAIMDSAYGSPKVEISGTFDNKNTNINLTNEEIKQLSKELDGSY